MIVHGTRAAAAAHRGEPRGDHRIIRAGLGARRIEPRDGDRVDLRLPALKQLDISIDHLASRDCTAADPLASATADRRVRGSSSSCVTHSTPPAT